MRKLVLNHKIVFLVPRVSNDIIPFPIVLLNNKNIKIEELHSIILDAESEVGILVTQQNHLGLEEDIYYFPITNEIVEDFKEKNFKELIINNGYLDNFTETENILIPCNITNKKTKR